MRAGGGSEQRRSLHYYLEENDNKGLAEAIENGGDLEERVLWDDIVIEHLDTPLLAASRM